MKRSATPNFSQIVCGAREVRAAFMGHRPTRFWWMLILALHGRPVQAETSPARKREIVADGFRFYAQLYRGLAVVFGILAPLIFLFDVAENLSHSAYWASGSALSALYLWVVSGLGFVGARNYCGAKPSARVELLGFMTMIVGFLSVFVAAVSVAALQNGWANSALNLGVAVALFVFGVGSYFIEIVYLATEEN